MYNVNAGLVLHNWKMARHQEKYSIDFFFVVPKSFAPAGAFSPFPLLTPTNMPCINSGFINEAFQPLIWASPLILHCIVVNL